MKTSKNILINILKGIYCKDFVTASQIGYSNANQYLIKLEKQELIIRNWSVSRYKIARINPKKINEVRRIIGADFVQNINN